MAKVVFTIEDNEDGQAVVTTEGTIGLGSQAQQIGFIVGMVLAELAGGNVEDYFVKATEGEAN